MKRLKIIPALLLTGVMAISMTACSQENSGEGTAAPDTQGQTQNQTDNGESNAQSSFSGTINVISREEGSGTRGAFVELFGIEKKDADGNKVDYTVQTADITSSTGVMMTSVAGDKNAIGYISLGALDDSVKALKVDGAEATAENVINGSYKAARPFNIAIKGELSEAAQDFVDYILSDQGQAIIAENGYIPLQDAPAYSGTKPSGTISIGGSTSVGPVMQKLQEAYVKLNPNASIEIQTTDSTTGMNDAAAGTVDIGMASRALKDSEIEAGLTGITIATDGIAVVVSPENPTDNITSEQVMKIYTGEITDWSDLG